MATSAAVAPAGLHFTRTGRTAFLMAKARPGVPILALTPEEDTWRKLAFSWGTCASLVGFTDSVEEMFLLVEKELERSALVKPGQSVVIVCGFPVGRMRPPNMLLLHTLPKKKPAG